MMMQCDDGTAAGSNFVLRCETLGFPCGFKYGLEILSDFVLRL